MSEDNSVAARRWLASQEVGAYAISDWVVTELASALSMKVRTGQIQPQEKAAALSFFQNRIIKTLEVRTVTRAHFLRSYEILNIYAGNLRAADALHLAIAEMAQSQFVSYDVQQAAAARFLGLSVLTPQLSKS